MRTLGPNDAVQAFLQARSLEPRDRYTYVDAEDLIFMILRGRGKRNLDLQPPGPEIAYQEPKRLCLTSLT